MAYHGIARVPGPIPRKLPPLLDVWLAERHTGVLTLRLETPPGQFVSPGTGRLALTRDDSGSEIVVQGAERRGGEPVIPGSGIKGAVRTLFEILSWSCDPFDRGNGCSTGSCCQTCAIFGLSGWGGRVGFSDAGPAEPGAVQVEVQRIPIPHPPHSEKTEGDFRLYDLDRATEFDKATGTRRHRARELAREVYSGMFETRMTFWNLHGEELGRLLLCLGSGLDAATRFPVRLGGVKYDGKGAVWVTPTALRLAESALARRDAACEELCSQWIEAARGSDWARSFKPQLEQIASLLSSGV